MFVQLVNVISGSYLFDADPNGTALLIILLINLFNFSHHKLTAFEYADGVNNVVIKDYSRL